MQAQSISRRRFLKAAGLTVAGATLASAGLGYAATRAPAIDTPELMLRKEATMNQRIPRHLCYPRRFHRRGRHSDCRTPKQERLCRGSQARKGEAKPGRL